MERRYNETAFTPEEVDRGAHLDLIKYLLSYNEKAEHRYNDIHITSDGYCTIVQWVDCDYECDDTAKFRFVDEDQYVMTEYRLPDNSTVMCFDKDEYKEYLEEYLDKNKGENECQN